MNPEKHKLLERRKQLIRKPYIDMTPTDMLEYEQIVKRLNEIELYEIRVRLKKRTEADSQGDEMQKTGLDL